jgi:hypothetical protein
MTFKYLYQTKENENREGEIKARSRDEAYTLLRKQGIRPYRVIGEDPWNWRPWAIAAGYAVLVIAIVVLLWIDLRGSGNIVKMTEAEAEAFRLRAEDAVYNAPEAYRYNVWKGVNARLAERGLPPLEKPIGLEEPVEIFGD